MKNTPGDIIILHMCTINDNHVISAGDIILYMSTNNYDHMMNSS